MRGSMEDGPRPGENFRVTSSTGYVDTLTLYCLRALPPDLVRDLRNQYRQNLIIEKTWRFPAIVVAGRVVQPAITRSLVSINQPRRATLQRLAELGPRVIRVNAVHIAIDFLCGTAQEAKLAGEFLKSHVVQKWRPKDRRSRFVGETTYWNPRCAKRNIVLYPDKPSKTGRGDCAHLELRFIGAQACKRVGLDTFESILTSLDLMALVERQAKLVMIDINRLDRRLEKLARQILRNRRPHQALSSVQEIKTWLQRTLYRLLQKEVETGHDITLQELSYYAPRLLDCLTHLEWSKFSPAPTWWWPPESNAPPRLSR